MTRLHPSEHLPDFSLNGRLALITGSAQGLGFAIAQAYAASGASVILNGRDADRLAQAVNALREQGADAHAWQADLSDTDAMPAAFQVLCDKVGVPDILVNNVGMRLRKSLAEASPADIHQLMQTNLLSCVLLSRLAAEAMRQRVQTSAQQATQVAAQDMLQETTQPAGRPAMQQDAQWQGLQQAVRQDRRQGGRIITLTSIAGRLARAGDAIYPIAKQGLEGLVRALAVEYGPHGITSNGIAPGTFATETNAALAADPVRSPQVVGRNPLGRWASPDEIAGAAVFLASPAASYVNGHIMVVDGGFSVVF